MSLFKQLENLAKSDDLAMHMPGHKRNAQLAGYLQRLSAELDVTEIHGFDELHHPTGVLKEVMTRAEKLWRSDHTYLLINGSTCGILAGIHSSICRGDRVLVARACHKSVYNGLALLDAKVSYLTQTVTDAGYCLPVDVAQVQAQLQTHPDIKLVIVTSPTYEGYLADVEAIAALCHAQNVPLMVDEAHGAHLDFSDYFEGSAVGAGADLVVQSLHKTLPSLTQTAVAHCNGNLLSPRKFAESLAIFETSSPSYLLLASIEGCIDLLTQKKDALFEDWKRNLQAFYSQCTALKHLQVVLPSEARDPSKILIDTSKANLHATALKTILREEFRIELEMAYGDYALAMTAMGDTIADLDRLMQALLQIDSRLQTAQKNQVTYQFDLPEFSYSASKARELPTQIVPVQQAIGQISAGYLWAYPPGVPLVVAGERIDTKMIDLLQQLQKNGVDVQDSDGLLPEKLAVICSSALDECKKL